MRVEGLGIPVRAAFRAGIVVLSLVLTWGAARAEDKTYVMKITTPTLNDAPHQLAKNFGAAVERESGGRIKAEVYPASQLGSIPRQIEGVQFGAIQAAVIPPEFYVGIDERFEVMAAPGLVDTLEHGQRVAADPNVLKLMLSLGADKGLHGAGLFEAQPDCIIFRTPVRHLADFQGKKIRIFASDFQSVALKRLGSTPVAMTLGDVLPALQQGAIDGGIAGITVFNAFHYQDAAKYVTETNQPAIFLIVEISKKWYDSLPPDLQKIVDKAAATETVSINPIAIDLYAKARKAWTDSGGELISLPRDEQASMMHTLASVGDDVSKAKPAVRAAYEVVTEAARKTRQAASQ
ncbi:MAG TPA: TRAP transporter substrate-binding protein [Xanthobacteraceae bacterium]|nr:TRAP transporter substrate-binding protein [Xanthobacteraceae bacterium]